MGLNLAGDVASTKAFFDNGSGKFRRFVQNRGVASLEFVA